MKKIGHWKLGNREQTTEMRRTEDGLLSNDANVD